MALEWAALGACRGMDPRIFFPLPSEPRGLAKRVCATCPVRVPCLEHGLRYEDHGIWGGTSERERRRIKRRRRVAGPARRSAVAAS